MIKWAVKPLPGRGLSRERKGVNFRPTEQLVKWVDGEKGLLALVVNALEAHVAGGVEGERMTCS